MTALFAIMLASDWIKTKTVWGVAVWNFQTHMVLREQKKSTGATKVLFLADRQKSNALYSVTANILTIKFCWNGMETVEAVGFWKS